MNTQRDEHTIRLDQFLKLANLVRSGGEAKYLIQSGQVLLNGVVETRRSLKIRPGDQITLGDVTVEVAWEDDDAS